MMKLRHLRKDERGVAVIEAAFALPILIMMIWMFVQLAQVYRAVAGIQQALGQGARYATLWPTPDKADIKTKIQDSVAGIGSGRFTVDEPTLGPLDPDNPGDDDKITTGKYYDLRVSYTQPTSLLLVPGPNISVSRSKRVWIAGT